MEPIVAATFAGRVDNSLRFDFSSGWQCRVWPLAEDLVRVLFLRGGEFKEPRTWMVAPGGGDVPWEGRDRLDTSAFARPDFKLRQADAEVVVATSALALAITLKPFGLRWSAGGKPFASDRPTYSYQWGERAGVIRHYMAREPADRFYGLGDKTGRLDKHGRRLRTLALDALGYDARSSDPLYKHWPFMLGIDGASSIAFGLFYDTLAPATFDLGCEYDNYH
ncbi:MAG TPA: alpha-glucosidase, partial [Casimicrobiaceae bacterium]|nr:alpha-glucosidase [Casimicrobiaceae bacterium]